MIETGSIPRDFSRIIFFFDWPCCRVNFALSLSELECTMVASAHIIMDDRLVSKCLWLGWS